DSCGRERSRSEYAVVWPGSAWARRASRSGCPGIEPHPDGSIRAGSAAVDVRHYDVVDVRRDKPEIDCTAVSTDPKDRFALCARTARPSRRVIAKLRNGAQGGRAGGATKCARDRGGATY